MLWTFTVRLRPDCQIDVSLDAAPEDQLRCVLPELAAVTGTDASAAAELFDGTRRLDLDTVIGVSGLRAGAVIDLGKPSRQAVTSARSSLALAVRSGPDAGAVVPLRMPVTRIGRDPDTELCIGDPQISRLHAEIAVRGDAVVITDLGSTNGTTLDGARIDQAELRHHGPSSALGAIQVGDTRIDLIGTELMPATTTRADGTILVNRGPRIAPRVQQPTVVFPVEPQPVAPGKLPVLSSLLPLVAGVGLALALHSVQYLLFAVLSPLMLIGTAVSDRRGHRRGRRTALCEFVTAARLAEEALGVAVETDRVVRHRDAPDLATVHEIATGPGQRLWERRSSDPDAYLVRIGCADQPAQVTVNRADGTPVDLPTQSGVPVVVGLRDCPVLGLCGPSDVTAGVLRSLLLQLVTLHDPDELLLWVVCDAERFDRWSWARWLPQLRRPDGSLRIAAGPAGWTALAAELGRQQASTDARSGRDGAGPSGLMVLVVDSDEPVGERLGLRWPHPGDPSPNLAVIASAGSREELPAACSAVVEADGESGRRAVVALSGADVIRDVIPDGVGIPVATTIARALSPLVCASRRTTAGIPRTSRLLRQLDLDRADDQAVAAGWRAAAGAPRALLGETAGGQFWVDLARDGPHALIAGTTGAGKSELLQTIIASLAAALPPDAITFVLVDYKGGAAFKDCVRLPHTVGLVTDLDTHLTERALTSLAAELRRRERLLAAAGTKDIEDYQRERAIHVSVHDRMPRLVLVVDEFATLVDELPDFVAGLVGIAMRGRSLGVHLILATQRPSGVVSPVIRANTNLRIALRVTDEAESSDVIDAPSAARIEKTLPGRAFARIAAEPLVQFQTSRIGGVAETRAQGATLSLAPWRDAAIPVHSDALGAGHGPGTDLQRLATAIGEATLIAGIRPVASPWLPPLPTSVVLEDLAAACLDPPSGHDQPRDGGSVADKVPIGLADLPSEQRRAVITVDLARGHAMAVAGAPRSGRTTVLRTVIGSAVARMPPEALHLYAIDCAGGALVGLTKLPHCGTACGRQDLARADRLLKRIEAEVDSRLAALAADGFSSISERRQHIGDDARYPWMMLLVDGWDGFDTLFGSIDHGRPVDLLLRLAREGIAAGLRVIVTGDRAVLAGRVGAAFPTKLVLRMPDPMDYAVGGLRPRAVPDSMPDGRALLVDADEEDVDGDVATEMQVALLDPDPRGRAQAEALLALGRRAGETARAAPPRSGRAALPISIKRLPDRVDATELRRCWASRPRPDAPAGEKLPIGVGGDDADAVAITLGDGSGFLIAGPARSGRSTALRAIADGLLTAGMQVAVLAGRRSPLHDLAGRSGVVGVFGPSDATALRDAIASRRTGVLVDDVHTMTDSPGAEMLTDMLIAEDERIMLAASGRADELAVTFRGLSLAVRKSGSGLLLQPAPGDGDLLGVQLPRLASVPIPGRGVLVDAEELLDVQVASGW